MKKRHELLVGKSYEVLVWMLVKVLLWLLVAYSVTAVLCSRNDNFKLSYFCFIFHTLCHKLL